MNERQKLIDVVEKYFESLRKKDLDAAPFADDVEFINPMSGRGKGIDQLHSLMTGFLSAMDKITPIRYVCERENIAVYWEVEGVFGIIPILELFTIKDGKITESIAHFDPRPIIGS